MRITETLAQALVAVALLGVGCLAAGPAAAAPPSAAALSPPAAAQPAPADPTVELVAAVRALSAQVEEQTKLIAQLQRRVDEYSKQINGRLMATCLAAMTAVPSPSWGLPIGKADKAGIFGACTRSDGWSRTYFDTSGIAMDVFAPFR
jgi:hypothetical protein